MWRACRRACATTLDDEITFLRPKAQAQGNVCAFNAAGGPTDNKAFCIAWGVMRMSEFKSLIIISFLSVMASMARADVPLGLWQSSPDASGLVVHVRTKPCGRALCGRIERA
tara:strand:+ start:3853 stop:4188 length:336 start_codon:yes stop_codon:yes gene_type:complete